jgi:hypothetical protein
MQRRSVQAVLTVSLAVVLILMAVFNQSWAASSTQVHESAKNKAAGANRLRGVFIGEEKSELRDEVVGRMSIVLIEGGRSHQVGIDHIFRSGDKFRFEITSNRDGWLSILHRSPGGELQLLWPKPNGEITASNHVRAKARYVVPPSPSLFVFDDEVGKEFFYVAIEAEPRVQGALPEHHGPELYKSSGSGTTPPPRKKTSNAEQRIINFKVRGGNAVGLASRGVVFDPGPEEFDPNVYFSASKEDDGTIAVLEFQLRHEK